MALEAMGYSCILKDIPFKAAKEKVIAALVKEGFGVLTEIDLKAAFKANLDLELRNYAILGVCNPQLAEQALNADPHAGLLIPCNVVIQDLPDGNGVIVSLQNPAVASGHLGNHELEAIGRRAEVHIQNVVMALGGKITAKHAARLEDLPARHPEQYPGKGIKGRLDNRREILADIKDHAHSEGLEIET